VFVELVFATLGDVSHSRNKAHREMSLQGEMSLGEGRGIFSLASERKLKI
jgi:hypothetical protein